MKNARVLWAIATFTILCSAVKAADWNQFRGPNRDNLSTETGLTGSWPSVCPERVMTATGIGEGYSTVAVVGDLIYTMGNRDGAEQVFALDKNSGNIVWQARNGGEYREGQGNGPRGTPTVVNGKSMRSEAMAISAALMPTQATSSGKRIFCSSLAVRISHGASANPCWSMTERSFAHLAAAAERSWR